MNSNQAQKLSYRVTVTKILFSFWINELGRPYSAFRFDHLVELHTRCDLVIYYN